MATDVHVVVEAPNDKIHVKVPVRDPLRHDDREILAKIGRVVSHALKVFLRAEQAEARKP